VANTKKNVVGTKATKTEVEATEAVAPAIDPNEGAENNETMTTETQSDGADIEPTPEPAQPPPSSPPPPPPEPENPIEEVKTVMSDEAQVVVNNIIDGLQSATKKDIDIDTTPIVEKIKPDELIPVRSMVRGGFNWRCKKSQITYRWPCITHLEYIPYEDVYNMYTNHKSFLTKPLLIVEDSRVINQFKLLGTYKDISSVNDLKEALNDANIMKAVCEKALSVNMRELLVTRLVQERNDGGLTNVDVIEVAEKILDCEIVKS